MLSHGYPPTVSGVTLVVRKFGRAMAQRGHTVTVITASERRKPYGDWDGRMRLIRVRSFPNPFWREGPIPFIGSSHLRQVIDEFGPDIIHTHEGAILGNQLLRLKKDVGVPLISSCYYIPRYVTHYLTWRVKLLNQLLWRYAVWHFNQFDHVIFSTSTQASYYYQNGLRVPTTIISNGLDTTRYTPSDGRVEEVEARYNLPSRPRILFVGRLMKDKKIDILIEAIPRICALRQAHLLLVGRGDEQQQLEQLAVRMKVRDQVHLLGFVPEEDLPAIYRASDVFAIASVSEVQSIPTLQAAACGLPVVAADAAALPELVRDGVNGFLVPPDSPEAISKAILKLTESPTCARSMGLASLAVGRAHGEERSFEKYEQFCRTMIEGRET
ncbi:MAG TPA: glycosyltransferase [Anaerolineales bacterium]|nr:glycosyltransferase [Anaerolineales bacterium]